VGKKALFQERWERVQAAMEAEDLDGLVVASRGVIGQFGNVFYLCGYTPLLRVSYAVLMRSGEPVLFLPSHADEALALARGIVTETRTSAEMEVLRSDVSTVQAIVAEIKAHHPRRVGIVGLSQIVPVADHLVLQRELDGIELVDASAMYSGVKEIKTRADIGYVKAAFQLAQRAYDAAPGMLAPGARAQDVVAEIERVLRSDTGAEALVFVDSAPDWVRRNTDTVFSVGDLVMVLVEVATVDGYFVEQGGLFSLGEPTPVARVVADACYGALGAIRDEIRAGVSVATITEKHEEIGRDAGLRLGLALGHGIGVDHDLPTLYRTDTSALKEGHLVSVHPYYWHPSGRVFGGVGDAFYVTADGNERMGIHNYELTVL
jgi:Xaa-Pro aminopeptidase